MSEAERDVTLAVTLRVYGGANSDDVSAALLAIPPVVLPGGVEAEITGVEIPSPLPRMAGVIRVERVAAGAPVITVDGQPFPWWTGNGSLLINPVRGDAPGVTVTILASRVEVTDDLDAPKGEPGARPA